MKEERTKIWVVVRATGQYEDFREDIVGYSLSAEKANAYSAAAQARANALCDEREEIWADFYAVTTETRDTNDERWGRTYDKAEKATSKLRSKWDPEYTGWHERPDYSAQAVEELPSV